MLKKNDKINIRINILKGMVNMEENLDLNIEDLKKLTPEELVDLKFDLEEMSDKLEELKEVVSEEE